MGELWMNPLLGPLFVNGGVIPPRRHVSSSVPVPSYPQILGARFTWQGLAFEATLGSRLSNLETYVHD